MLAAGISRPGWLENLDRDQRRTLADAVAGLYKISGVERVHTPGDPCPRTDETPGTDPGIQPPARFVEFADVAIPWRAWVEVWEDEGSRDTQAAEPTWQAAVFPDPQPSTSRHGLG